MATEMLQYIDEQPRVWRHILAQRAALTAPLDAVVKDREIRRVLLVGTGSSGNAALAAKPFWEELLGREVTLAVPTRLDGVLPAAGTTLALVISQSGRSTSTLAAATQLRSRGFQPVAVTADPASPVAAACGCNLLIDCGAENVGPKTKGFTATVLTLYIAAMRLAELLGTADTAALAAREAALQRAFDAAEDNLTRGRAFCALHGAQLAAQPHFTFIADGAGLAVACEGALKVLETLYVPAFAYEFEEYLHGVNNTIGAGQCNILLLSSAENAERMLRLDRFCRTRGCHDLLISALPLPADAPDGALVTQGSGQPYTQIFETLLVFQQISALVSERKGFNVDKPKFADFYSQLATKL